MLLLSIQKGCEKQLFCKCDFFIRCVMVDYYNRAVEKGPARSPQLRKCLANMLCTRSCRKQEHSPEKKIDWVHN